MGRSQEHDGKSPRRPYVILNGAVTLDGKIATRSGDSRLSSAYDLRQLHRLRSLVDAVMIGIGTELNDNPLLTVRFVKTKGQGPFRIVVDSLARTPPNSRILSVKDAADVIVAVSKRASGSQISRLERSGAEVICCGTRKVDLKILLSKLYRMGIRRILLEGGGTLNWSMLTGNLVDEIRVTVTPMIVGGQKAKTLVEGVGVGDMDRAMRLSLTKALRKGNELILSYKVKKW